MELFGGINLGCYVYICQRMNIRGTIIECKMYYFKHYSPLKYSIPLVYFSLPLNEIDPWTDVAGVYISLCC